MSIQLRQVLIPLPEPLKQWISLNADFHVLICRSVGCEQALSPGTISRHLRDKHHVSVYLRKQLEQYIQQWQWPYDHQSIPLPVNGLAPQPILPILDGFQCYDCSFLSSSRNHMRKHVTQNHGKKRAKDEEIFTHVRLQTWVREKRARYWVVDEIREKEGVLRPTDTSSAGNADNKDDIKANIAKWEEDVKKERLTLSQKAVATEIDPWLRYTDWERVLAESTLDLVQTHTLTVLATNTEPGLVRVQLAWTRILEQCLDTLESINHKDYLKWWASPKPESPSQIPFERVEKGTLLRYSQTFQRLLLYVIRTAPEVKDDETETGVVFTSKQWLCVQDIRRLLHEPIPIPADERPLTVAIMALSISLITEDTSQMSLYEAPVMHYLAVRGIDTITRTFRTPASYTPILAQMLWIIRLLLLEVAVCDEGWPELGLQSRTEIGKTAGAVAARMKEIRLRHLVEGSFSPASSILTQLARGQAINRAHQNESNIFWSDDRQTVFYEGKGIIIPKLRVMCHSLTDELEALLYELLFHQSVQPLPLAQLVDSMGYSQLLRQDGYSFIDHAENAMYKVSWEFLYRRMQQDASEYHLTQPTSHQSSDSWIDKKCHAYLGQERLFLTRLFVAVHIEGGQPGRSPEIGSAKVRNNVLSARNIYIVNGRVALVTTYDKAQKRRGKTQYVFRCFSDRLSQLIAQYLTYVLPFSRVVGKRSGDFLFADENGPWIKNQLSAALAETTQKYLGVRLTVSSWRQVVIAIGKEHLHTATRVWGQEDDDNKEVEVTEGDTFAEAEQNLFNHILVRQSGHGGLAAHNHYAIDGGFLNQLGPDLVNAYSQASRAWHAFLHLESKGAAVLDVEPKTSAHRREASQQLQPALAKRGKSSQREAMIGEPLDQALEGLRRLYGPDAEAQSKEQLAALELIHQPARKNNTKIFVLPTGSGKSVLFFSLAAMAINQAVILVVPFTALVQDLLDRGRSLHIRCEEWRGPGSIRLSPQLIIISADQAVTGPFLHYAKGLELSQQLAHVFFDECHVAFTDTSYRQRLRQLWQLRYLDSPFTCLTATLPVQLERVLRANLLLEQAQLFRWSTMRKTIRYQVIDSLDLSPSQAGLDLIQSLSFSPGERGIIYVRSYATGNIISSELQCAFYQAHADDKGEALRLWASNNTISWIVATGALGTGINIPGIIYIIHIDRPYGLTSFMQQAGRGGRDGEVSDSYIITRIKGPGDKNTRQRARPVYDYLVEQVDEDALDEFLDTSSCRRAILAQYFDGAATQADCIWTDSILCDCCQKKIRAEQAVSLREENSNSSSGLISGTEIIARAQASQAYYNDRLSRFHQLLQRSCIFCQLMVPATERLRTFHHHRDCPIADTKLCGIKLYEQWRSELTLASQGQCYRCGLSQQICLAVELQGACEYPDLLLPGLFFLYQVGQLLNICQEVGFQGIGSDWSWKWMNLKGEEVLGQRELNWVRVWRQVGEIYLDIYDKE